MEPWSASGWITCPVPLTSTSTMTVNTLAISSQLPTLGRSQQARLSPAGRDGHCSRHNGPRVKPAPFPGAPRQAHSTLESRPPVVGLVLGSHISFPLSSVPRLSVVYTDSVSQRIRHARFARTKRCFGQWPPTAPETVRSVPPTPAARPPAHRRLRAAVPCRRPYRARSVRQLKRPGASAIS
jgi:hypothetical protein